MGNSNKTNELFNNDFFEEETYVMIKPETALNSKVVLEIEHRIKKAGLKIVDFGYVKYTVEDARQHYIEHYSNNKPFYPELEKYITSDVAYGMIVKGIDAIQKIRYMICRSKDSGPQPGDIRYDIAMELNQPERASNKATKNIIHASSSEEDAKNEIKIFKRIKQRQLEAEQQNKF